MYHMPKRSGSSISQTGIAELGRLEEFLRDSDICRYGIILVNLFSMQLIQHVASVLVLSSPFCHTGMNNLLFLMISSILQVKVC